MLLTRFTLKESLELRLMVTYTLSCRTHSPNSDVVEIDRREELLQTSSDPESYRPKEEDLAWLCRLKGESGFTSFFKLAGKSNYPTTPNFSKLEQGPRPKKLSLHEV